MCELLYFLDGAGRLVIDGSASSTVVHSGDSILAPAGSIQVVAEADDTRVSSADVAPVAFLRVVLPLSFVVQEGTATDVVEQCRCAAGEVCHLVPVPVTLASAWRERTGVHRLSKAHMYGCAGHRALERSPSRAVTT